MSWEYLDPLLDPRWNAVIQEFPSATFFYTKEWVRALAETYGYRSCYAVLREGDRNVALLPLMEVDSRWTGKRAVGLPFSDECAPLTRDGCSLASNLDPVLEMGRQRHWGFFEVRGGDPPRSDASVSERFLTHTLALESSESLQRSRLRDSTRRNIQKSERERVEIEHGQGSEDMELFYSLHCQTRRRHGLPPQPIRFFRLIHEYVIKPGHGFVSLARYNRRSIAGAVYFRFGTHAIYKFGASDVQYQHLRANNLLMWSAIRKLQSQGIRELSLGRTDLDDAGLLQFKRGWGAEEKPLSYYRFYMGENSSKAKYREAHQQHWSRSFMRRLPIPILRAIGSIAYRHIA
jgi:hypothetical protein